jgi:hypothetical protein
MALEKGLEGKQKNPAAVVLGRLVEEAALELQNG